MLSREERILGELLVSRGQASSETLARCEALRETSLPGTKLRDVLLAAGHVAPDDLERIEEEARQLAKELSPELPDGFRLGEFRLVREIGRGAMGIVFEAEQESLGRRVALKVLPAGAALDERLSMRFLREARAVAGLNHEGIVPVITSGRAQGVLYFAMELIDGRSLDAVVTDGPMPPERAARIAADVARALAHAHAAGLVHRDVKPGNVLVDSTGRARITDFGLVHDAAASGMTLSHHVLGTPSYMAPEQAKGAKVDARADVYGLGATLHAMLSGKPPYAGEIASVVLARVLSEEPADLTGVRPAIPLDLIAICRRAMARRPEDRHASSEELAEDLERFLRGEPAKSAVRESSSRAPFWRRVRPGMLAALLVAAIVAALRWPASRVSPPGNVGALTGRFTRIVGPPGSKMWPDISPDGRLIAWTSEAVGSPLGHGWVPTTSVWMHEAGRDPEEFLNDSGGAVFSPKGSALAFWTRPGIVRRLDLVTRHAENLSQAGIWHDLTWSPDGRRLGFADGRWITRGLDDMGGGRVFVADVDSASITLLTSIGAADLSWSPHGQRIAFRSAAGGSLDIWTIPADGGAATRVTQDEHGDGSPVWSPDGRWLYFVTERERDAGIVRVGIDETTGAPSGDPERVADWLLGGGAWLAMQRDGRRLLVAPVAATERLWRLDLAIEPGNEAVVRVTRLRSTGSRYRWGLAPDVSPDGRSIAFGELSDDAPIARLGLEDGVITHVTSGGHRDGAPRWSPDGTLLAFESDASGRTEIWTVQSDGFGLLRLTDTPAGAARRPVWSPDGLTIAYVVEGAGAFTVKAGVAWDRQAPLPLAPTPTGNGFAPSRWSPDGSLLAGTSGGIVIHDPVHGTWERCTTFGENPAWLPDGRRLLFAHRGTLFVVDRGGGFRPLLRPEPAAISPEFSVSADGRSIYCGVDNGSATLWALDLASDARQGVK